MSGATIYQTPHVIVGPKSGPLSNTSQIWMLKNLSVTSYRNGDPIPCVTDNTAWASLTTGAYCFVNGNSDNTKDYGLLYNFYAVTDPRGLAPSGWRVPTNPDWEKLSATLTALGINITVAANVLRAAGTTYWNSPNTCSTNSTGFTIVGAGSRLPNNGSHTNFKSSAELWSSTPDDVDPSLYGLGVTIGDCTIDQSFFGASSGYELKTGLSVRCVKDT